MSRSAILTCYNFAMATTVNCENHGELYCKCQAELKFSIFRMPLVSLTSVVRSFGVTVIRMRCDDDLQWVRALTVPMHLGLIDRPFVPHNLTSAEDRPVRVPNGPPMDRDGIVLYSILIYIFLSKTLRKGRPSMFPQGPLHRGPPQ
jgi:hypothetical protein